MESFNLGKHIPKSLDCRHAVCTECVMNPSGPPLQKCPICRQNIIQRSALPNDFSIMTYLESNSREQNFKRPRVKVENLIVQVLEASEDVDQRLKETVAAAQTVKNKSDIFHSYMKQLFEKCQQRCSSERLLTDDITNKHRDLENIKQELEASTRACMSLLDKSHVSADEADRCESKAMIAVENAKESSGKSQASDVAMWNIYRKLVMDTFTEISKVPPYDGAIFDAGNFYAIPMLHCSKQNTLQI